MEKILVIDDEEAIVDIIADSLEDEGYEVLRAYGGYEGMGLMKEEPDLIILDIMMPDLNGLTLCRGIRDRTDSPIIFLSAKNEEEDKIRGLGIGGDDYMTKPFSIAELIMRVKVHLRREGRYKKVPEESLEFDNILIDLKSMRVFVDDLDAALTKKEYEIVETLALNHNQTFSRNQLYEKIWGYDAVGELATITEHIKNIRSKLGADSIRTVWGIGYKWEL